MTGLSRRRSIELAGIVALGLVPLIAGSLGDSFYIDFFSRVMIFAIAALSLDLIMGYGGMVSFGHAVYLGVGSYAVGILSFYGVSDGYIQFGVAIVASALVALFIGALSLRTRGVHFIMITLAFSQMVYFLAVSLNTFGGDDGMTIKRYSDFGAFVDLKQPTTLYYLIFAVLLLCLFVGDRLVESRFGMAVRGIKLNERRMVVVGFRTVRYKLTMFVISGVMCGIAGALIANLTLFVSPVLMQWTRSGEIIMMVILGGAGTLFGPVLGSVLYLILEKVLSGYTEHWQLILGPFFVLIVLYAKRGVLGLIVQPPVPTAEKIRP
jgi:branched-chain amino acid transport system permease protein